MRSIVDVAAPSKPPYMKWKVYEVLVAELKKLQNDYYVAFLSRVCGTSLFRRFLLDHG